MSEDATMITYKEYAHRYGFRRPSDVLKYIEDRRIEGVKRDGRCKYLVPEDALINHVIHKKRERNQGDNAYNLIQALNLTRNVNARILEMRPAQYESLLITLQDGGVVRRDRETRSYDSGLALTQRGIELARLKKRDFSKLWQAFAAGAVEGGGKLLLSSLLL